jgi:hypothetical protein
MVITTSLKTSTQQIHPQWNGTHYLQRVMSPTSSEPLRMRQAAGITSQIS